MTPTDTPTPLAVERPRPTYCAYCCEGGHERVDADEMDAYLSAQLSARDAEVGRLREALWKYGDHMPECGAIQECGRAVKPACTCGFDAALAAKQPKQE